MKLSNLTKIISPTTYATSNGFPIASLGVGNGGKLQKNKWKNSVIERSRFWKGDNITIDYILGNDFFSKGKLLKNGYF